MKKETDFSSVVIRQGSVINIHLFTPVILSDACERQLMLGRLQDTPVNAALPLALTTLGGCGQQTNRKI